jgi:hypothetical protein
VLLVEVVAVASLLPIVVVEVVVPPVLVGELPVLVRCVLVLDVALTVPTTTRFPGTMVLYFNMSSVCGTLNVDKRVVS